MNNVESLDLLVGTKQQDFSLELMIIFTIGARIIFDLYVYMLTSTNHDPIAIFEYVDFLRRFKDKNGGFIESLQTDVKGLLSLYEASHLAFMEESDLHEAKLFAMEHLLKLKDQENEALEHINHSLEFPLYQSMLRLQARYYIDACHKRQDVNFLLRELATLDFNMIQAAFKVELKEVSK